MPFDCFAYARNDTRLSLRIIFASLRASPLGERGKQRTKNPNTFDCFASLRKTETKAFSCALSDSVCLDTRCDFAHDLLQNRIISALELGADSVNQNFVTL